MDKELINIYIDSSKPYYYPGESFLASILLDVIDTVNCNKMVIKAKGKLIINATQKKIFNDTEENLQNQNQDEDDDDDEEEDNINKKEPITEIKETKQIFNYTKVIEISKNNNLKKGKYSFPFEIELPNNIPGSFLFFESKTYAEIIYYVKVKLSNINIEEKIPIIIRQKEEIFNYQNTNEYTKNLTGCCCEGGQSIIKLETTEDYTLSGDDIKINVNLNNTQSGSSGSPINIEVYQKLILKNKHKNKKIKVTRIIGKYKGRKIINPRENFKKKISITLDKNNYTLQHLSETKSLKYFKNKNVIPLLNQSIKSDLIINEYEVYAESQFSNLTAQEIGVFLNILIFPPEKGILAKNISKISEEFSESIINNKKIFLNDKTKDNDSDFEYKKDKNDKNKYDMETQTDKESIKSEQEKEKQKVKIKEKKKEKKKKEKNNNIENIEDNFINDNINNIIDNNKDKNLNINEDNMKKSNRMTEEISFGTSTKDKMNLFNIETTSNNIKKNFNQNFLDDALDEENLDVESMK